MNILSVLWDILKATLSLYFEMAPYLMLGLFFVALLNYFFTKDLIVRHVGKDNFLSVLKAALFGVPLPLCSCGVVPSAVYMSKNGASKGAVVSFLISTPQTGIDSIIATWGILGPVFGIFRPFAAFVMGIFGGTFTRFIKSEEFDHLSKNTPSFKIDEYEAESADKKDKTIRKIIKTIRYAYIEFVDDISSQFIVGILIGGLISYFIPDGFFANLGLSNGILGMLIMVAIGIPMYVCATASIPIAVTLMMKGFSPGVAFVFLASGPATNAASLSILTKVLGKKVTFAFVGTIVVSSMIFGTLLDMFYSLLDIDPHATMNHAAHHHGGDAYSWYQILIIAVFTALIIMSLYRKFIYSKFNNSEKKMSEEIQKFAIDGMTCNHCVMNVKKAITSTSGVTEVEVSLNDKAAYVKGNFSIDELKKSVEDMGYKVV